MTTSTNYNLSELLACVAARLLEDNRAVFVGTGLPMISTMLAQRTHAPNILIIFEAGGIGPQVPVLPGYIDYAFLGAAAMDMYGNLNTTVIGDWDQPKVRLPGSGGANDLGSLCWRTLYIMRNQSARTFMKKLDFVTTPGWLAGDGSREAAGLPAGCGPYRVITQLGVYGFDAQTKRLTLLSLHPGVTVEEVQTNSDFEILVSKELSVSEPPSLEEQHILREIDPAGVVLGK